MRLSSRRSLARAVAIAAAAAIALVAAPANPQERQPQPTPQTPNPQAPAPQTPTPQAPTFRTGTNLIRVDVTVIDGRGKPVTSLTADDFEVRDDGAIEKITSFKLVEATGQATDEQPLEIRSRDHAAAEAAKDDVRVFLIFWDEYHISPFVSALHAREDLTRAVLGAFAPADLVAIMDPLTPLDAIRFTRDRRELANQVHTLQGRRGIYTPPRSVIEEAHLLNPMGIERIRCQVTESAVTAGAAHLGTLREGPSALIIISEGFGPCGPPDDEPRRLRDLIRVASGSHTAIFVADPRGLQLQGRISMFLQSLAAGTGGEASQSNDLGIIFTRAVTQASAFYLLGYPKEMPMDGRFHEIKVRVKPRGLEVRSRAGYWAPRAEDVAHAKAVAAAAEVTPEIAEALARLLAPEASRSVEVWTGTAPLDNGRTRVTVAWMPRRAPASAEQTPATLTLTATSDQTPVYQGTIAAGGTSFEAPAGPLQLAIAVLNAAGEIVDREVRVLPVPDAASSRLALSTPVLFRARTPREASDPRLPVYAGRDFDRTDRVLIRVSASGASREEARVSARLLSKAGAPLSPLEIRPDVPGGGYLVELPLTAIARGEFIVSVEASRGGERAEALVAFRVVR